MDIYCVTISSTPHWSGHFLTSLLNESLSLTMSLKTHNTPAVHILTTDHYYFISNVLRKIKHGFILGPCLSLSQSACPIKFRIVVIPRKEGSVMGIEMVLILQAILFFFMLAGRCTSFHIFFYDFLNLKMFSVIQ